MKEIWEIIKKNFVIWFWIILLIATSVYTRFPTDKYPIRETREVVALVLIAILFIVEQTGHLAQYRSYKNKWLTLLLGWIFVSHIMYFNNWTMQTIITLTLFTYLAVTSIRHLTEVNLETILKALCWLIVFQCFYCMIQLLQYDCIFYDVFKKGELINRPVGTLENEGIFGAYLSFLIPLCFIWRKWKWNLVGIAGIIFLIISQSVRVETQSLSAIISGITAIGVYIFLRSETTIIRFRLFKKYITLYIKKLVIAGLILLILTGIAIKQWDKVYDNFIDYHDKAITVSVKDKQIYHLDLHDCGRVGHWKESLNLSRRVSWWGFGIGRYKQVFPLWQHKEGQTCRYYRQAHNDHLQVLNELGIIGFILYLLFMVNIFKKAWSVRHNWIMQGVLAGSVAFMVNAICYFPMHVPHLAAIGVFYLCCIEIIGGQYNA